MATLYVRKSGNDANDGSTPALAKLTLGGAVDACATGDTIYLGAGLYNESWAKNSKHNLSIIGDVTGVQTGDAGEVRFSNKSGGASYQTGGGFTWVIEIGGSWHWENIIFSDWHFDGGGNIPCLITSQYNTGDGHSFKNVQFYNIFGKQGKASLGKMWVLHLTRTIIRMKNVLFKNIYCTDGDVMLMTYNGESSLCYFKPDGVYENIVMEGICAGQYSTSKGDAFGLAFEPNGGHVTVKNVFASLFVSPDFDGKPIYVHNAGSSTNANIYNAQVSNCLKFGIKGNNATYVKTYNCNVVVAPGGTATSGTTDTDLTAYPANFTASPPVISQFSELKGLSNATKSSADIFGNPRPAYGNTNGDIGHAENTYDDVQREATIKDSGDYSMRVQRPNWFKKTFQIPVTASALRTVKVKVRIDGTWGTTRPKVTLSGQGMAVSSATKDATTGVFHELTVSGTPTSTGIALLTIEAHVAPSNTDAIMYVDTVTIS